MIKKKFFYRPLFYGFLLLSVALPASVKESWQETGHLMKLMDLLDRKKDGYCLDVVGSGNNIRFDMPLITHNCKEGLYADEAVVHKADGTLYFPAYDGCVTVMGLNNHALAYNALILKRCHVDEPFLAATRFQKFSLTKNKQLQLKGSNLCITTGDVSKETYSSAHRWRSLYMQDCKVAPSHLSQWSFVRP
ncbi:MAG: hypothetical protein ACI88H_000346 [Cocleimonas sp.]|jgi:hypothetical protein